MSLHLPLHPNLARCVCTDLDEVVKDIHACLPVHRLVVVMVAENLAVRYVTFVSAPDRV